MLSALTVPVIRIGRLGGASGGGGPTAPGRNVPVAVKAPSASALSAPVTEALPQSNSMSVFVEVTDMAICCPPHSPDLTGGGAPLGMVPRESMLPQLDAAHPTRIAIATRVLSLIGSIDVLR